MKRCFSRSFRLSTLVLLLAAIVALAPLSGCVTSNATPEEQSKSISNATMWRMTVNGATVAVIFAKSNDWVSDEDYKHFMESRDLALAKIEEFEAKARAGQPVDVAFYESALYGTAEKPGVMSVILSWQKKAEEKVKAGAPTLPNETPKPTPVQ